MLSRKRHCLWVCPLERVKADLDCLLWSENGISMQISTLPWLGCPCLQANMDKGIFLLASADQVFLKTYVLRQIRLRSLVGNVYLSDLDHFTGSRSSQFPLLLSSKKIDE